MKRLFKLMTLGFSIVISGGYAVAQNTNPPPPESHFCPDVLQDNSLKSMNCTGASTTDYDNKYSWQSTYIPNSNTPIKVIKIAFHFFQDANGGNMWPDNQNTRNVFTALVNNLNNHKSNVSLPVEPISGVMHIADSRIRFECTGFYFYQNNSLNQDDSLPSDFETYIASIDPDRLNSLGIFYTGSTYQAGAGNYASGISNGPWGPRCSIVMYNTGLYGTGEGTVEHELGHSFGLWHTYNSEYINKSHKEYLSDVFNVPWGNFCSPPPNTACYHEGGWNWDPTDRVAHPHCTNNLMGACSNSWYMSPLQMGRMHRELALLGIRKYVKEMTSEATYPWIITSNETWDFDIQMYQDIVVKPGNTLTIRCKLGMANNGRIIVERGARLIIDGGEVFPWGTSWEGIQVWGTSSQRQTINASTGLSPYHGIVKVINGGTLRRARNAIVTTKAAPNGDLDWGGYFGGIVQCDNANFINNHVSVAFMTHHNYVTTIITRNLSFINRSIFEVDNDMGVHEPGDPYLNTFVSLWGVEGVLLQGNIYRNNCNPLPPVENRGYGIVGYDGSFTLSRYKVCSVYGPNGCAGYSVDIPSRFENLHYGVHITESAPLAPINLYENDFMDCNRAIYMSGTHNTKIQKNKIEVGDGNASEYPYGIYSDWSTAYDISNNEITDSTLNPLTTGIYIYETGGLSNMIYRNKMNNLYVGTTVMGDNRGLAAGQGLRFQCNEYGQVNQNRYDIWLNNQGSWYNPAKIDAIQGNSTNGANNRFSHYPANFRDFYSPNYTPVTYFYNPESSTATQPIYYSISLAPTPNATSLNWATSCPENRFSTTATTGGSVLHNRLTAIANLDAAKTDLSAQIDNNSTQWFLDAISGAITVPANDLKTALVNASPYLSDEVLIATIMSPVVTPNNIATLHKKNAPVTQPVMEAILSLSLSPTIMGMIDKEQSKTTPSERAKLEAKIASLSHDREFELNEGMKDLLNDSTGYVPDSLALLIEVENNGHSTDRLAALYAATNQVTAGEELFQSIKETNGSLNSFCRVQEIILAQKQTERNVFSLRTNEVLKGELVSIAEDLNDPAHVHAQSLLSLVFGETYREYVELPSSPGAKGQATSDGPSSGGKQETASKNMVVFPNPSNGKIYVSHLLKYDFTSAELIVYSVNGTQMLQKAIDKNSATTELLTEDLKAGIYFVFLSVDGEHVETQKFVKQ